MDIDDDEFDSLLEDRERAEAEQHQEQEYPDDVIRPDEHRAAAQEEEEEEDVPLTRSKRPPIEVMPSVMDKRPRTLRGARLTLLGSETDAPFDEEDDDAAMRPSQSLRSQDDAMVVEEERPRIVMPVGPRVFVAPPVTGKYVSVRDPHNRDNTFYLRFRAPRPRSDPNTSHAGAGRLLERSIADLTGQINELEARMAEGVADEADAAVVATHEDRPMLLVNKYAPARYADLLSDERANRQVLLWLKSWDRCVFGRAPPPSAPPAGNAAASATAAATMGAPPDAFHRPEKKILLLSGPPGLGKTTLAAIAARQAGYNVVEINASDDRSPDVLRARIRAACEMRSVMGDKRPNVVVLDECDGILNSGPNPLEAILKLLDAPPAGKRSRRAGRDDVDAADGEEGNAPVGRPLCRPIICVCNDPYAPVLRALHRDALHVKLPPTTAARIVRRLRSVCSSEGITASTRFLSALTELCERDVRSCLNTLQFLRARALPLDPDALLVDGAVGRRDVARSLASVVDDVFVLPKTAARVSGALQQQLQDGAAVHRRASELMTAVEGAAVDVDRVVAALFANYLGAKYTDIAAPRVAAALDWMAFYDRMAARFDEHELMPYHAVAPAAVHYVCATAVKPHIELGRVDGEVFGRKKEMENIVATFAGGLSPAQRMRTPASLVLDFFPLLMYIITPELKAANATLMSAAERSTAERLVSVLVGEGLLFKQYKEGDAYSFALHPPLDQVALVARDASVRVFSYATMQMVSAMQERVLLRRREDQLQKTTESRRASEPVGASVTDTVPSVPSVPAPSTAPALVVPRTTVERVPLDFFGRPLVAKAEGAPVKKSTASTDTALRQRQVDKTQTRVWYKFHEGVSNAVRKRILVADFVK